MIYKTEEIGRKIKEEVKKNRYSLESFAEMVKTTRPTLTSWFEKGDMPLSKFLEICDLLSLNPNVFFGTNNGNIQNAVNNKGVTQTISNSSLEYELLKQENGHLKDKVRLLERLLEAYQK